jgi:FMN phosphatase YigB (HAD superfamily)
MIKFVYFDVGGVAVADFSKSNKWSVMKNLIGVKPEFEKEFDSLYDKYESEICLNRHVDTLIPILAKSLHLNFPKDFSMNQYMVDHFDANKSLWPVIYKMQERAKVGLLTNMYVDMFDLIVKKNILPPVKWDVVVDSSIVKMIKPNLDIYEYSQKAARVKAMEILFVDNKQENIDTAKKLGWQTFFYDSSKYQNSSHILLKCYLEMQK